MLKNRFPKIAITFAILGCLNAGQVFADTDRIGLIKAHAGSLQDTFPVAVDWSYNRLTRAILYAQEAGSTAVIVLHKGRLVLEWGKTTLRGKSHSVRKSLLSALYGIAVEKNKIDLTATLAQIGINDRPPCLTEAEKTATIKDLLKARSGVYHLAAAESEYMRRRRPSRGAFAPGEHWYYNNWDFNVLGTIFERKTNLPIGEAFKHWIADPIGMQDFRIEDVHYYWETVSIHPSIPFWISARDLARFGQLYLQKGKWENKQVISAAWINESTTSYSKTGDGGYGYMWWIHSSGAYYAAGYKGQKVLVIPDRQIVIVNSVYTGTPIYTRLLSELTDVVTQLSPLVDPVDKIEFNRIVELILEAAPK